LPPISSSTILLSLLGQVPPWTLIAALVGLTSAAAFFVIAGRGFRSLPTYLVLGLLVAPFCQIAGASLPPLPLPFTIGEVHLVIAAGGTWGFLTIARLLRL
jgi:hypothetical protein